jgi:hypothetical protein
MYQERQRRGSEEMMVTTDVSMVGVCDFGIGAVGRSFDSDNQASEFGRELGRATGEVTQPNTAICMDGRIIVGYGNGVNDPERIKEDFYFQLQGGLVIPITKALIMADAAILRDVENMGDAYLTVANLVDKLQVEGTNLYYQDSCHDNCAANQKLVSSVDTTHQMPLDMVKSKLAALSGLMPSDELLILNRQTQQKRFERGFFDDWDPTLPEDYVKSHYPERFAHLKHDEHSPTKGHNEYGLLIFDDETQGFSKNQFAELADPIDGQTPQAFALTPAIAYKVLERLTGSDPQQLNRAQQAFWQDVLQVSNVILSKDANLKVYKASAAAAS